MKEKRWAQTITEMSKDFMLRRLKDTVRLAGEGAALRQYMCDGTPELTVHREVGKFGRIKIARSGKRGPGPPQPIIHCQDPFLSRSSLHSEEGLPGGRVAAP